MTLSLNTAVAGMTNSLQNRQTPPISTEKTDQSRPSGPPPEGASAPSGPPPNGPPPEGGDATKRQSNTSDADLLSLFDSLVASDANEDTESDSLTQITEGTAQSGYAAALSLF